MCVNCNCGGCKGGGCVPSMIIKVLLIVGGLNWGLVGVGMLLGHGMEWNVVQMVLGFMPVLEGIVYVLVGLAAVLKIFNCKCKKCREGTCAGSGKMEGGM